MMRVLGIFFLALGTTSMAAAPESFVAQNSPPSDAAVETTAGPETPSTDAREGAMTLDAITIEGAVDVPQVLFISARDHLRDTPSKHQLYWTNAVALVLDRPTYGPVRPPVDASATAASAPQREN